jgi:hypothetical protein
MTGVIEPLLATGSDIKEECFVGGNANCCDSGASPAPQRHVAEPQTEKPECVRLGCLARLRASAQMPRREVVGR